MQVNFLMIDSSTCTNDADLGVAIAAHNTDTVIVMFFQKILLINLVIWCYRKTKSLINSLASIKLCDPSQLCVCINCICHTKACPKICTRHTHCSHTARKCIQIQNNMSNLCVYKCFMENFVHNVFHSAL